MKILVTGASGFLGKFLVKKLSEENEVVTINSKICDLTRENSLDRFNYIKFDMIYHLAAWTQAGNFCLYHPAEQWIVNQKINTNVLSWWQQRQSRAKFIAMGTSCSYDPDLPHTEENYLKGLPTESLFTYAMTKRMLLAGLKALNKQFSLEYLYLIPSTLYGKGYHLDGRQMHFIFDLIQKIMLGKFYNKKVELWGNGDQIRELVYVEDFVDIMTKLSLSEKNTLINIGAGKGHSIKEFAKMICEKLSYDEKDIFYDRTKYVGAEKKVLIVEKMKRILPDYEGVSLKEGLGHTIDWFLENKSLIFQNT